MNTARELMKLIETPRALSKALPKASFICFPVSYSLMFWMIFLKAISQPQSLMYFIPSITSVVISTLLSFRRLIYLTISPFLEEIKLLRGVIKINIAIPTNPTHPICIIKRQETPTIMIGNSKASIKEKIYLFIFLFAYFLTLV